MDIHALPVEIYERIYRFLDPSSHLDFALTNKHLYSHSYNILKHHGECYSLYRTCSDWSADTFANNLRAVATDHIAAWHVRTVNGFHASVDYEGKPIGEATLNALVDTVQAAMIANGIAGVDAAVMRRGDQEALQVAFIMLCSGLETIKSRDFFPARSGEEEDREGTTELSDDFLGFPSFTKNNTQNILCNLIRAYGDESPSLPWPPGFNFLDTVIIGAPPGRNNVMDAANVAPIFLLPNIRTIYLGGLFVRSDGEAADGEPCEDWDWKKNLLPAGSSSVEHLFIERATPFNVVNAVGRFAKCPKALRSFIIKDCDFNDFDIVVSHLRDDHGSTLEIFMFGSDNMWFTGYRCAKFIPDEFCEHFKAIGIFTVDMVDVRLGAFLAHGSNAETDGMTGNVSNRADFIEYFATAIPESTAVLVFRCSDDDFVQKDLEAIVDALVQLLENESHPNLQTVYLDEIFPSSTLPDQQKAKDWWSNGSIIGKEISERMDQCCKQFELELCIDAGSTRRYIDEVCDSLFDLSSS